MLFRGVSVLSQPQQSQQQQGTQRDENSGLNTLLLTGCIGLLGWSLVNTRRVEKKTENVIIAIQGYPGQGGGILDDIKDLKKKIRKLEDDDLVDDTRMDMKDGRHHS